MHNDYYLHEALAARYDAENGPERAITRDDIPYYTALARQAAAAGRRVLELGCGTGRVTIPMALAGAEVTGLDSSPQMLAVARRKAAGAGAGIDWVEADMADFEIASSFGLAVIPFRSFQLLLAAEAQTSCLARIHDHLEQGGRLALNLSNPAIMPPLGNTARPAKGLRVRQVSRWEMEGLLASTGFRVEALYGWFDERPFGGESSEMVWRARRVLT